MNYRKRAIGLMILWVASYMLLYVGTFIHTFVTGLETGFEQSSFFTIEYHGVVMASVLCYFLPLACCIRTAAAKAKMDALKVVSLVLSIFLGVYGVMSLVAFVYRLIIGQ